MKKRNLILFAIIIMASFVVLFRGSATTSVTSDTGVTNKANVTPALSGSGAIAPDVRNKLPAVSFAANIEGKKVVIVRGERQSIIEDAHYYYDIAENKLEVFAKQPFADQNIVFFTE